MVYFSIIEWRNKIVFSLEWVEDEVVCMLMWDDLWMLKDAALPGRGSLADVRMGWTLYHCESLSVLHLVLEWYGVILVGVEQLSLWRNETVFVVVEWMEDEVVFWSGWLYVMIWGDL